jgi:hypothetical protein
MRSKTGRTIPQEGPSFRESQHSVPPADREQRLVSSIERLVLSPRNQTRSEIRNRSRSCGRHAHERAMSNVSEGGYLVRSAGWDRSRSLELGVP